MKTQWSLIVALLFSLLIAVFAIVNNEVVAVNFLFNTVEVSLVLLILGSAAIGAVIMIFLSLVRHVRVGFQMRDLKKRINQLEEELESREELLTQKGQEAESLGEDLRGKEELLTQKGELLAQKDRLLAQKEEILAQMKREAAKAEVLTEEEKVDSPRDVDVQEG